MNAIVTTYQGVRFRSRLEARWAAFFDLVGCQWDYEPLDLDGYIPDFVVQHSASVSSTQERVQRRRLVEVKPALDFNEMADAAWKIERSGWVGLASVVGAIVFGPSDVPDNPNRFLVSTDRALGLTAMVGDQRYLDRYGLADWKPWRAAFDPIATWREAGNRVQWRPSS